MLKSAYLDPAHPRQLFLLFLPHLPSQENFSQLLYALGPLASAWALAGPFLLLASQSLSTHQDGDPPKTFPHSQAYTGLGPGCLHPGSHPGPTTALPHFLIILRSTTVLGEEAWALN